eukprot:15434939-Alexandrium_andersonii.AAC.1
MWRPGRATGLHPSCAKLPSTPGKGWLRNPCQQRLRPWSVLPAVVGAALRTQKVLTRAALIRPPSRAAD